MKTYASQIIFSIKCDGRFTGQYEEQWRMVYAESEEGAIEKAKLVGSNEAAMLVDRHGRTISWEMIAIKQVREMEVRDGSLLSSMVVDVAPIAAPVWEKHTAN